MMFNATFNNISVISWWNFIGGGNRSTRRKPPTRIITDGQQQLSDVDLKREVK
jgi:hypothetical protein